jgi:RNA polymerase-binding transcription factor
MDIKLFKSLLLEKKAALMEEEESGKEAAQVVELDQTSVGRVSRMDAMQGQAMAVAANQRRQIELQKIGSALKRVDQEEYGYCLECEEEIAEPRLKLDPASSLCIDCASKKEQV